MRLKASPALKGLSIKIMLNSMYTIIMVIRHDPQ